jgi:hypothetical protein
MSQDKEATATAQGGNGALVAHAQLCRFFDTLLQSSERVRNLDALETIFWQSLPVI